jgi:hypothetical protein
VAYNAIAVALLLVYVLGTLGMVAPLRILAIPSAFVLLHTAGFNALMRPFRGATDLWG